MAVVTATKLRQRKGGATTSGGSENPGLRFLPVGDLRPDPRNPRKHSRDQIAAIANSIETFGNNAPILVDQNNQIIAGHGRFEAAKLLGSTHVPVICLKHLSGARARAYMLADNKLTDRSSWNDEALALHFKDLSELALDFELEATGFESAEIDLRIQSLDKDGDQDRDDEFETSTGPVVSILGDIWNLGDNRFCCGNALDAATFQTLMGRERAAIAFTDPPYNVRINGHASGKGRVKHPEFAMASGEMNPGQFEDFLTASLKLSSAHLLSSAVLYVFMDWRHIGELHAAGRACGFDFLNLCVWTKNNGGMGSFYRSMHELIFVFGKGGKGHRNNIQLGKFGRNRTNVWNYHGANGFVRSGNKRATDLHPTVKPVALVADAILDCTKRGDIVLDPFAGSGTVFLSAQRTGRRAFGIEISPRYVDTAIRRWQRTTGAQARHISGETFAELEASRTGAA